MSAAGASPDPPGAATTRPRLSRLPSLSPPLKLALGVLSWLPVAIFFFDNVYHVSWVSGRSMYPTFLPDSNAGARDLVLLKKWNAKKNLHRGEVVVYRSPTDPEITAIKRIVGLEGDVVATKAPFPLGEVVVPRNHVWVEGDDIHSHDSNHFGAVCLRVPVYPNENIHLHVHLRRCICSGGSKAGKLIGAVRIHR
ncbi:hypothetical protein Dda_7929 [Drechslerella dactyloides]|uniref:Mitochondrial inner membrane protease subunit n=1 Tax=Drechslerella dactyloides TaxID=74499 RepID=A0AAD6IR73_DREDA|nr:hypothetical protein Dda_7929 [Drechslerella dactyloides]